MVVEKNANLGVRTTMKIGEALADGCGADAPGSYVAWLCLRSTVYAMEMPGRRYDIENLESLEAVKRDYLGIPV